MKLFTPTTTWYRTFKPWKQLPTRIGPEKPPALGDRCIASVCNRLPVLAKGHAYRFDQAHYSESGMASSWEVVFEDAAKQAAVLPKHLVVVGEPITVPAGQNFPPVPHQFTGPGYRVFPLRADHLQQDWVITQRRWDLTP